MLGQVGHILTGIADSVMVGNISADHLAASSLGHSIYIVFFIIGLGIATGITPLIGIAFGEKNTRECSILMRNGLLLVVLIGVILSLVMIATTPLLGYLGQSENVVKLATPYYLIASISLIPSMLFVGSKQLIEGTGLTKPSMNASIVFNILNIILNYLLIYGNYGFPRLELEGAAWATLISRIGMGVSLFVYIMYSKKFKIYRSYKLNRFLSISHIQKILTIGFPISLQFLLEVASFSFGAIMSGWINPESLAAHQVALSIAAFTYLAASGIASAATIRISHLNGEKKFLELKKSAISSYLLVLVWMSFCAILMVIFRFPLAELFVTEIDVIKISATLLIIAAVFQLFDGLQVTSLGILRGLEDVKLPTIIAMISYWLISLPVGYALGILFRMGVAGVWLGFLVGLISAASLLFLRYLKLIKKLSV